MEFVDEYRDKEKISSIVSSIKNIVKGNWKIMEICGGQTHSIAKFGLAELLPKEIDLVHGPGCPVCVTPIETINNAIELASKENIIFCSFGDMLRIPGSEKDLLSVKASGGDIRVVYSPLDALKIARENQNKEVVFFAIGFETTAPANALAVYLAKEEGLSNFSVLVSQFLVPPALDAILGSGASINGFLAPGHVCAVMGYKEYERIANDYGVPIVVTGFEPLDILQGIQMCVKQLEQGTSVVENQYARSVSNAGNVCAQDFIEKVFRVVDRNWRGIGVIENSGLGLKEEYKNFDAGKKFGLKIVGKKDSLDCISGLILKGEKKPYDCPNFGKTCTPENPLGATMVSSEGACAAYYKYKVKKVE